MHLMLAIAKVDDKQIRLCYNLGLSDSPINSIIPNTAVFGPTNFIGTTTTTTTIASTARMKISDEDFYGGRTGPLENFIYLFIFC